jgi:hypothetical protein
LASYKSNYTNWQVLSENVQLAKDVYKVVDLQYREGIKTYLDVIVSQADLRTAELNYYNALFQLLSSKIDLQRALGTLQGRIKTAYEEQLYLLYYRRKQLLALAACKSSDNGTGAPVLPPTPVNVVEAQQSEALYYDKYQGIAVCAQYSRAAQPGRRLYYRHIF